MITWRDILQSLLNVRGTGKLDQAANVEIDCKLYNIDLLDVEDKTLIAFPVEDINKTP